MAKQHRDRPSLFFIWMNKVMSVFGYVRHHRMAGCSIHFHRRRIIIVGWRADEDHFYPAFDCVKHQYTVSDILSDLPIMQAGEEKKKYYFPPFAVKRPGTFSNTNIRGWYFFKNLQYSLYWLESR